MSDEPCYCNVTFSSLATVSRTTGQETWSPAQTPKKTELRHQPQQCAIVFLSLTCAFLLAGIIALFVCYYLTAGQLKMENSALMEANQQLQELKNNLTVQMDSLENENKQLRKNQTLLERRCSRCPSGWTFYNSKCYFVHLGQTWQTWKTWNDSRLECFKMRGDLLTIQNKQEQMFIMNLAPSYFDKWHGYWIGLTRQAQRWVWINGSSLTTGHWADAGRQNGTHVLTNINSETLDSWRQAWPEMLNRWICEKWPCCSEVH